LLLALLANHLFLRPIITVGAEKDTAREAKIFNRRRSFLTKQPKKALRFQRWDEFGTARSST
jgi:hypothetical protein